MTRRRFFSSPNSFEFEDAKVLLTSDEARHLRDVLRLKVGDEVFVFNGAGKEFRCSISKIQRDTTELDLLEEVLPTSSESPLQLTLGVALLKGDKFDLVVQKTTELGVHRIVPIVTRYADIHLRDSSDTSKRLSRWQRIALEAAKQSGRAQVPGVEEPVSFSDFISECVEVCVMFSERAGRPFDEATKEVLGSIEMKAIVGSEGGWSDEELELAQETGWRIVTLAGRILRAETAAITVTALLQHRFGDLK